MRPARLKAVADLFDRRLDVDTAGVTMAALGGLVGDDVDGGLFGAGEIGIAGEDMHLCRQCPAEGSWERGLTGVGRTIQGDDEGRDAHRKELLVRVILGDQKYVNVETPRAIAGLRCMGCGAEMKTLRSFKCHNWAYAINDLARLVEQSLQADSR
jgi:hypothetical protein